MLFVSCLSVAFVVCQLYLFFVSCICCLSVVYVVCQVYLLFVSGNCCLSGVSAVCQWYLRTSIFHSWQAYESVCILQIDLRRFHSNPSPRNLIEGKQSVACTSCYCVVPVHYSVVWPLCIMLLHGACTSIMLLGVVYTLCFCVVYIGFFFFWVVLTVATNSVVSCVRNETVYLAVWAGAPSCRKMKNSDISFM